MPPFCLKLETATEMEMQQHESEQDEQLHVFQISLNLLSKTRIESFAKRGNKTEEDIFLY